MNRLVVPACVGALTLALLATNAPSLGAQGAMRDLACRGNAGMVLRVDQDPSPRNAGYVTMVLEYRRPSRTVGNDLRKLEPGTCTWNRFGYASFPVEPGRVRFDVRREAQRWSATERRMIDTTVLAGAFYPDPITLPRYLLDSTRYWKFYVNDATNFSPSHGVLFESGRPTFVWITGPVQLANDARRDLLCRGGTSGLLYGGGASIGNNQAKVQLSYRVSPNVPGNGGAGLTPGSCAWTSRTAMPREPGKIWFVTSSNAQLRQMQSGVPIDRSPTAAERYPDVRSIPEYLKDPAHYWRFTVASRATDSALAHGPWKPDYGTVVAGGLREPGTSTERAQPAPAGATGPYTPGTGSATSRVNTLFDIKNVTVTPSLEGVVIRFEAAANSNPKVTLTPVTVGAPITLAVGSSASTPGMMRYVAASNTPLSRNTLYSYRIDAPATTNARANGTGGAFKTLGQFVRIAITRIDILSDGDSESAGDFGFEFRSCPRSVAGSQRIGDWILDHLQWSEGPHPVDVVLENADGTAPERFRLVAMGVDNDHDVSRGGDPTISCNRPNVPQKNQSYEWNYAEIDFDLTKYPGVKAGDQFVRRSKPFNNSGSRVAFEIRGSILVTRQ